MPFILLRLLWRSRKAPDYRKRVCERLGYAPAALEHSIWVHAVSVGETIAATPFIKALQKQFPNLPIVVTNMTPTGSARAKAAFGDSVKHAYVPYDIPGAVTRFINRTHPKILIVMETELWPNLFSICKQKNIPILLANARLSEKSARGYRAIASLTREMLSAICTLASQGFADAERFIALGMKKENVIVTGNIKFDLVLPENLAEKSQALRTAIGTNRLVWIAASTHPGEDEIILSAHHEIRKKFPNALLILVPRHPERFNSVAQLCTQNNFSVARRSLNETCSDSTAIYLADTMGEMMLMYSISDIAFVAGSFAQVGGHNMLEPAALGKPIITGPVLFNFAEISEMLINAKGMIKVTDANELAETVARIFADENYRKQVGGNALSIVEKNRGALRKQVEVVERLLNF